MLHPAIVKSTFSLFECQRIEGGDYKMKSYLGFDCYSSDHILWIMLLSVPSLIIWVIGIPLFAFIVLLLNRNNLNSGPVKQTLLVLYQGLKPNVFYWEFVNTLRKVLLLLFSTVLSVFSLNYSALISVAILVVLIHVQIKLDPYDDKRHNQIEIQAVVAGTMTLFCGIIFDQDSQDNENPVIIMLILIFLVIINLIFIIRWLYLFIKTFNIKNAKVQLILQILASLILERHEFEEVNESDTSKKSEHSDKMSEVMNAKISFDDIKQNKMHNSYLYDKSSKNSKALFLYHQLNSF